MARSSTPSSIFWGFTLFLSVAISLAALLADVSAEQTVEQPDAEKPNAATEQTPESVMEQLPDDATLLKMKVRELKAILERKGPDAQCLACTSKKEYVDRIHETADWPYMEKKDENLKDEIPKDGPSMEELKTMFNRPDNEEMQNLMKKLKDAGIDASNVFSGSDFDSDKFEEKIKNWKQQEPAPEAGAGAADSTAKDDSHVEL